MEKITRNKFSIEDLSVKTGLSKRNIRYYIQKGLVNSPVGKGKAAYYTGNHLEQLQETVKWKKEGLSLERIQNIVRGIVSGDKRDIPLIPPAAPKDIESWYRLFIIQGVELNINTLSTGFTIEECRQIQKKIYSVVSDFIDNIEKKR